MKRSLVLTESDARAQWIVVIACLVFALIYSAFVVIGVGGAVLSNKMTNPPRLEVPLSALNLEALESEAVISPLTKAVEDKESDISTPEVLISITIDELDATAPRLVWSISNSLLNLGYAGVMIVIAVAVNWSKSRPVFGAEFAKLQVPALVVGIVLLLGAIIRGFSEPWVAAAYGLTEAQIPASGRTNPFELFGPLVAFFFFFATALIWRQGSALQEFNDETV